MKKQKKVPSIAQIGQPSAFDFFKRFPTEKSAMRYLESARWPAGVRCIHCGHESVYIIRGGKLYTCKACRKQFTLRTGTVMESSHLPFRKWIYAMYLVSTSRKGISSVQLAKELGITQKAAWHMLGRLRAACATNGRLTGTVEADETYIGGKEKNKHQGKKLRAGRGTVGKSIVWGARSRDGEVRAEVIANTNKEVMVDAVQRNVAAGATLYTDEHGSYQELAAEGYNHDHVRHGANEYVRGNVHTNSVESFWALLKRGHYGTFHQWSTKHLHRYVHEFLFRQNTKGLPAFDKHGKACGISFVRAMVAGMEGKRLTYKTLIA